MMALMLCERPCKMNTAINRKKRAWTYIPQEKNAIRIEINVNKKENFVWRL